ncbi:MAG: ferredoxin--NADP reductase [Bdellovibrionales bacterium]|nr:ferredoxin--NADP reductase [Bdellovibrionales bacterium]
MLNATLQSREEVAPGLFVIKVLPDKGVPDFLPGQYVAMGLPHHHEALEARKSKLIKRAYSIASSPDEKEAYEFFIALVEKGDLTPRLQSLKEGDRLYVADKVVGAFTCEEIPSGKRVFFVSTGTGIAPYISMLRNEKVLEKSHSVYLLHGVRYSSDLAYRDELLSLSKEHPHFHYLPTISREDPSWTGERGYVQHLFKNELSPNPETDHIFLCGNPGMIDELEEKLLTLGFILHSRKSPGNLHVEKYW